MPKRELFDQTIAHLCIVFERSVPPKITIDAWYSYFKNVPGGTWNNAIRDTVLNCSRFPSPADISKHIDWTCMKTTPKPEPSPTMTPEEHADTAKQIRAITKQLGIEELPTPKTEQLGTWPQSEIDIAERKELLRQQAIKITKE